MWLFEGAGETGEIAAMPRVPRFRNDGADADLNDGGGIDGEGGSGARAAFWPDSGSLPTCFPLDNQR